MVPELAVPVVVVGFAGGAPAGGAPAGGAVVLAVWAVAAVPDVAEVMVQWGRSGHKGMQVCAREGRLLNGSQGSADCETGGWLRSFGQNVRLVGSESQLCTLYASVSF